LNQPSIARETFKPYRAKILNVLEADTIFVEVEVWPNLFQRVYVRIKGVDSAEPAKIRGGRAIANCEKKAAQKAIKFVERFIEDASLIEISNISQIKSTANYVFARINIDGKDLGEALVTNKHAISFTGLKRKRWSCRNL